MTDYEAFVHELIGYIFKVQDKDDDNLSAEIICRKLYKYGLIENVNHKWRMKYRPKYRWPATVHNGRADKEDWQSYTKDRKTENCSKKPNNCEEPQYEMGMGTLKCDNCSEYGSFKCTKCDGEMYFKRLEPEDEPTISKMEQVEDEPQTDCGDFADRLAYERGVKHAWEVAQKVFNSTVTFYEAEDVAKQIDKDINVRSKDEPQTEKGGCTNCDGKDLCNNAFTEISQYCGAYEPQNGYQTFNGTSVYVSRLEDEPQTDCSWK